MKECACYKYYVQGGDIISTGKSSYLGNLKVGIRAEHWRGDPNTTRVNSKQFWKDRDNDQIWWPETKGEKAIYKLVHT